MNELNQAVPAKISVIIPTFMRSQKLKVCINKIFSCEPSPSEILVHIDYGDDETEAVIEESFPHVVILKSQSRQGPGGGRNRLIRAATHELVVSFDDDSFPVNKDFFQKTVELFERQTNLAILGCQIIEPSEAIESENLQLQESASFIGCGCIYRKSYFLKTDGYLPLALAYGMEEVDISLQLLNIHGVIAKTSALRVFHETDLERHASRSVNAAHIANTALLIFLRYPLNWFPYGCFQVANRVIYAYQVKRFQGILSGLLAIPVICWRYRRFRKPVSDETLRLVQRIRSSPQVLQMSDSLVITN